MFKLVVFLCIAAAFLVGSAVARPQVLVDGYAYYASPSYVAAYSTPWAYTYPYSGYSYAAAYPYIV